MDKITIVTVAYNAENDIEKTMCSVLDQSYENIEYIIIDGKSQDDTLTIAKEVRERYINNKKDVLIISEKDNGIYDAMNKGIRLASGIWILFLNTGDYFHDNNIISDIFINKYNDNTTGIYGDTIRYCNNLYKKVRGKPLECIKTDIPLPFCHQSVFVKTDIMKEFYFNTTYKYAADYDFFVKCFNNGCEFEYVEKVISCYSMGGISEINTIKHLVEKIKIRENYDLERYTTFKKNYLILKLTFKQRIKKLLPDFILDKLRGFHK